MNSRMNICKKTWQRIGIIIHRYWRFDVWNWTQNVNDNVGKKKEMFDCGKVKHYLWVTSYEFKSTSYEFKFTSYEFESTSYEFKSTS